MDNSEIKENVGERPVTTQEIILGNLYQAHLMVSKVYKGMSPQMISFHLGGVERYISAALDDMPQLRKELREE